jgi:hypothetical protein
LITFPFTAADYSQAQRCTALIQISYQGAVENCHEGDTATGGRT